MYEAGNNASRSYSGSFNYVIPEGKRDKEKACTCLFRSEQSFAISKASRMRRKVQE